MYSHVVKGCIIGQALLRRLGRTITGIPGLLIDLVVAVFAGNEHYLDYWKLKISYADDTQQAGAIQGVFGWIGDIAGMVVGGLVGSLLGAVLYLPDGLLCALAWGYDQVKEKLDAFAKFVGERGGIDKSSEYLSKAFNISAGTLGIILAAIPWVFIRGVEFIFSSNDTCSKGIGKFVAGIGGTVGAVVAIGLYPVKYLCDKAVVLFRGFRDGVQSFAALVYAKTNWGPEKDDKNCKDCCSEIKYAMHSKTFRGKVERYKKPTTVEILFGLEQQQAVFNESKHEDVPLVQDRLTDMNSSIRPFSGTGKDVEKTGQDQQFPLIAPRSAFSVRDNASDVHDIYSVNNNYIFSNIHEEETLQPGAQASTRTYNSRGDV